MLSREDVEKIKRVAATPEGNAALHVIINTICQVAGAPPRDADMTTLTRHTGRRDAGIEILAIMQQPTEALIPHERTERRPPTTSQRARNATAKRATG